MRAPWERKATTERVERCTQDGCRSAARKVGEPHKPGNMWNQYWECDAGHKWTQGWFDTSAHPYEDVPNLPSHLISRHSIMVSVHATEQSMLKTHREQHA